MGTFRSENLLYFTGLRTVVFQLQSTPRSLGGEAQEPQGTGLAQLAVLCAQLWAPQGQTAGAPLLTRRLELDIDLEIWRR